MLGPVARITFDDAAGATELIDASGNNRNGVVSPFDGSATLGEAGLSAETGTALRVSGGGGGAIQGSSFDPFNEFGVSLWMNVEELGASADQMSGTPSDSPNHSISPSEIRSPKSGLSTPIPTTVPNI